MDVRCERCKTEYEFDDARITEAGVTVKCTTCGHVFRVKKKALVVTVPVKPEELVPTAAPVSASAAAPPREWKVRQANGNVFSFKELTTLQKWIVERKVSRDDEISLTGETWKRLGNIAELASFFQVVEEAQRAQLAALQSQAYTAPPPERAPAAPYPAVPAAPVAPPIPLTAPAAPPARPEPVAAPPAPMPPARPAPAEAPAAAEPKPSAPPQRSARSTTAPPMGELRPRPGGDPAFVQPRGKRAPEPIDDRELEAAAIQKRSASGVLIALLLIVAAGAGGYYAYTHHYLPGLGQPTDGLQVVQPPRVQLEEDAGGQAGHDAGTLAGALPEVAPPDAGAAAAAAPPPDAGSAPESSPVQVAGSGDEREPARDFDYYMRRGDRLRERERAAAALDAYGKAADLRPDRAEPIAGRGLALLDLGQTLQAEAAFQQALKLNGRYGVALIGLAEAYRARGKKELAIQHYERYLELLPNGPEASVARGAIAKLRKQ